MRLTIVNDLAMPPEALKLLRDGTTGHRLMLPRAPTSVLAPSTPDPLFGEADIAFGQPDPRAIEQSVRLKWVHVGSSGITRYDTPEFRAMALARGLLVTNSASVYQEPCALHALSFLLAQARELPLALATRAPGGSQVWDELRAACVPLREQTLLIVGYGSIGERLVELAVPLGLRVRAYRRRPRGDETIPLVLPAELGNALAHADHVMNILPLSPETLGFFDSVRFAQFKPGAVFYNIGRGATVDQTALLEALWARKLKAAWLDVTDPEPLPLDHPLLAEPRCYVTPHVAGGHAAEASNLVRHFLKNLTRFVRQEPLLDRVM